MSTDENLLYPEDVQLCKCMCGDWLGTLARTSGEVVVKVLGGITSSSEETVTFRATLGYIIPPIFLCNGAEAIAFGRGGKAGY